MRRRGCARRLEQQQQQQQRNKDGYLSLDEVEKLHMKYGFTSRGFSGAVAASYSGLTTCTHIFLEERRTPSQSSTRLQSMGIFSHRAWHKELEHQALSWLCGLGVHYSGPHGSVSQPWGSGKLSTTLSTLPTSPSSDRSTWSLSQKSQCPSGVPGKLDKWKARGRKVGRPVILYYGPFSICDSATRWRVEFHYLSLRRAPATLMRLHQNGNIYLWCRSIVMLDICASFFVLWKLESCNNV